MWELMPTDGPSDAVALLMYHAGVSVEMNYGGDTQGGSGAYSGDVPDALEDYFRYSSSIQYIEKSDYTASQWLSIIEGQIDDSKVVYYSGVSSSLGGHAFVCDGYRTTDDYLHFNFGWSGYSNGFYAHTDVNGFSSNQAAVINIVPGDTNYEFNLSDSPVTSVTAQVDTNDLDNYKNHINWEAPTKALTGYNLYRGTELVGQFETSVLSSTDYPSEPDNYTYTVRAVYDAGVTRGASATAKGLYTVTFKVSDSAGNYVHVADVDFNGETAQTGFGTANFNNVPFGGPYSYTITKDDLPTTTGTISHVYKDMTVYVVMGQDAAGINETQQLIVVYPNPSNGLISFDGLKENNIINVFDVNGKVVYSQNNVQNNATLDLSFLNSGIYFVNIKNGEQTVNHKIVIK